jgi:hypothetical protein
VGRGSIYTRTDRRRYLRVGIQYWVSGKGGRVRMDGRWCRCCGRGCRITRTALARYQKLEYEREGSKRSWAADDPITIEG